MKKLMTFLLLGCVLIWRIAAAGTEAPFKSLAVLAASGQPVDTSFQAVTWRNDAVVASGTGGGIYSSFDNGISWRQLSAPAGAAELQFRDNLLLANDRVVVMSAGEGADSGIFTTDDFGTNWRRAATGQHKSTFYDCFYMLNDQQGWLYGDSDENGLFVLHTKDGAKSWQRLDLPVAAQPGEGGFASSGTCLNALSGEQGVVIGTGNATRARLLIFRQGQWDVVNSPVPGGEAGGIFSVQSSLNYIYIGGGSLKQAEQPAQAWRYALHTEKWQALPELPMQGAVYGSALLDTPAGLSYWVSNPQGVWFLSAQNKAWQQVSTTNIWSLACQTNKGCIGVGKNGAIERYLPND